MATKVCGMDKQVDEAHGVVAQGCRADLRERFLLAVTSLAGVWMNVSMTDGIEVQGTLRAIDKDVLLAQLQNLQTPFTSHPWATLRLPDCHSFIFKL